MNVIESRIKTNIKENSLIPAGSRILLALSAGKDSMIMFHLLNMFSKELSFEIGIFHLNHLLRDEESDKDAAFVKNLAKKHSIPFFMECYDFNKDKIKGKSFEEQARDIRYNFMQSIVEKNGYDLIATAHNLDDNVETVLMRIFKGTGIYGLKGIDPKIENIIRPILSLSAVEIYDYLKKQNINWREDKSNLQNDYDRNYLRNKLIPEIKNRFPAASESIMKLRVNSRDSYDYIQKDLEVKLKDRVFQEQEKLQIEISDYFEDDLQIKEILAKYIREFGKKNVFRSQLDEIYRNLKQPKANLNLYAISGLYIYKKTIEKKLYIIFQKKKMEEVGKWSYYLKVGNLEDKLEIYISEIDKTINVSRVDYDFYEKNRNNSNISFVAISKNDVELEVRNRLDGDRIILDNGTKKIKDLLIENKISNEDKNLMPLLQIGSQIAVFFPTLISSAFSNRVSKNFKVSLQSEIILAIFS